MCFIAVKAQKINGSSLKLFGIVIASFQVKNKLGEDRFFQKMFLLVDISMDLVFETLFLTLSNANRQFADKKLTLMTYTTKKAVPTTRWWEFINKKAFAKAILDENVKVFVIHIAFLNLDMTLYPAWKAEIALLFFRKVVFLKKYTTFANVFLKKLAHILLEHMGINKYKIKLQKDNQPL